MALQSGAPPCDEPDRSDVSLVALDDDEILAVISLESLAVEVVLQATDKTGVTFEEALRLLVGVFDHLNWSQLDDEIGRRDLLAPELRVNATYEQLKTEARRLLSGEGPS